MTEDSDRRNRVTKRIRWAARIWSLPIIVYVLLLLIGYTWNWITTGVADPHAVDDYPPIENLLPIFMFLSTLGLGVAWRLERLGGAIALVFQAAAVSVLFVQMSLARVARDFPRSAFPYLMSLIVVIPGVLFLFCWRRSREAIPGDSA